MSTAPTPLVPISMALSDFVQGGLVSDVAVEVIAIQFRAWDYQGSIQDPVLAVWMQMGLLEENLKRTQDEPIDNYWSCGGKFDEVAISNTLTQALPRTKTAFTRNSNWEIFLNSLAKPLVASNVPPMPEDYLKAGDLAALLGLKFHLIRNKAPERAGIDMSTRKRKEYEQQVVVARQLYAVPWAKGVTGRVAAAVHSPATTVVAPAAAAQAAAAPVNGTADVSQLAIDAVKEALKASPMYGSVDELKVAVFRGLAKTKVDTRNAIVQLVGSPEWLAASGFKLSAPDASGAQVVS